MPGLMLQRRLRDLLAGSLCLALLVLAGCGGQAEKGSFRMGTPVDDLEKASDGSRPGDQPKSAVADPRGDTSTKIDAPAGTPEPTPLAPPPVASPTPSAPASRPPAPGGGRSNRPRAKDSEKDERRSEKGEPGQGEGSGKADGQRTGEGRKDDKKEDRKPEAPKVWKRDASRPSFARVYVGDGNSLDLVSLHVSVIVEGPRVRTLVDHVFRNPHQRQLEGTFEYPLPSGASPSYYAMFLGQSREAPPARFKPQENTPGKPIVLPEMLAPAELARKVDTADWGKLQEARIVQPQKAAAAYEEVVRGRVDPALLEYASGNTFRGRVFPIAPGGYNRVILAYEETLPVVADRLVYRFALPGCPLHEMRLSVQGNKKECLDPLFEPKDARKEITEEHVVFSRSWSDTKPTGDVVFSYRPENPLVQVTSGKHGAMHHVYARLRPQLPKIAREEPFGKHAVFLLDTSLSAHLDRFNVSMKLLKEILEGDKEIQHFNVLTFNAGAAWVSPKDWLPNTKEGRDQAFAALDGILLEGATDLSAAFDKLTAFPLEKGAPLSCFLLSDGHLTWGETDVAPLVARLRSPLTRPARFFCYRTGLGEENAELFDALTRDGGSTFQCFGEGDLKAVATAHRAQCLTIEKVKFQGESAGEDILVAGRRSAVYPGGELVLVGKMAKPGKATVTLQGKFAGQAFTQTFPVTVGTEGELAARGWGEVAVASLLALNDPWMEDLVTAYSQEFNIAGRSASFLVLENEAEYKRFQIDDEKGKTIKGDLGGYIEEAWAALAKEPSMKQAMGRLLFGVDPQVKILSGPDGARVKELLGLLNDAECSLPVAFVEGAILKSKDADRDYLAGREKNRRAVDTYLTEAQRRYNDSDIDGAIRVLSSVIEEYPGRGDALRLVGYRLLDLRRPEQAARLFSRVLRSRPFEPHSYRDLARGLEESGKLPLAALLYESVLAGTWHGRFGEALKMVTREDYGRLLRTAIKEGKLSKEQDAYFARRLHELAGAEKPADLRVTITWNTDATDIDLHIIEPDKTRVYYQNTRSRTGGELSQDQTQGYGPERYQIAKASKGEYILIAHYFRANENLLGGETHVNVTITRNAGTDKEKVERRTVILRKKDEQVEIARVRY